MAICFLTAVLIMAGCDGCATGDAGALREERDRVYELVTTGQSIDQAQRVLREKGYRLVYDKPIHPTAAKDYVQQLVIIGNTRPGISETVRYTVTGAGKRREGTSPYVIIEAGNDGVITRVE